MNVRKFSANTSREAIRLLRDALGSDAVILSNRNVDGRVEILAMADDAIGSIEASTNASTLIPATPKFPPRMEMGFDTDSRTEHVKSFSEKSVPVNSDELADVMSEIRSMRGMLEAQLAEISWANTQKRQPQKAEILREMLATGFSASLSRYLIDKLPEAELVSNGIDWIKSILINNLSTISNESEILEKGGARNSAFGKILCFQLSRYHFPLYFGHCSSWCISQMPFLLLEVHPDMAMARETSGGIFPRPLKYLVGRFRACSRGSVYMLWRY